MKHLIITGDDFGRSPAINEAIERCHEAGLLTQASLMVHEGAVEEAVRIAARQPRLCVGLHLALCAGAAPPDSPLAVAPGRWIESPAAAGLQYAFVARCRAPLAREIAAQCARFAALGFAPSYCDGHTHLHLHPTIFRLLLPVLEARGFHAVRLVREPGNFSATALIFRLLSFAAERQMTRAGLSAAGRLFGFRATGRMTTEVFAQLLDRVPEGWSELYFHPGAEPEELDFAFLQDRLVANRIVLVNSAALPPPRSAD